ncbi:TRPM8 channel-associated factor homolog [Leptodactylus fuscus]|uniref:TRPM8 channel-associated factor homolog n=1 Tax=Leptodactylus fuscus TaxID=238119 RepID=UPI003F4E94C0
MNPTESYKALVKNIDSLNFMEEDVPCDLLLSGDSAFPVLVNPNGQGLIAASQYGRGRLVVVAHEGYLTSPHFTQFIENAIEWLKPSFDSLVGVHMRFLSLAKELGDKGHNVESNVDFYDRFGVYCMDGYDDRQSEELIAALKEGKGLLIGGQASYRQSKSVLLDYPGNKVTSVAGIHFLSNYGKKGEFPVTSEIPTRPLHVTYNSDLQGDLKQLLHNITELHPLQSGIPSQLLVHGQRAFPLFLDDNHKTYLAAAFYGKGRVVVAGHENQFSESNQKQLVNNLIWWLDAGRNGEIGIDLEVETLQDLLEEGVTSQLSKFKKSFSVYCCTSYSDKEAENILEFVAEGGGLLIGGQAWYWASQNSGKVDLIDYPGNKIIGQFGISIVGDEMYPSGFQAMNTEDPSHSYHCRRALHQLDMLMDTNQDLQEPLLSWMRTLAEDCAKILSVAHVDKQTLYPFRGVLIDILLKSGIPKVSAAQPIEGGSKEAFLLRVASGLYNMMLNFEALRSQLIPETSSLPVSPIQSLEVDCTNTGGVAWRSTGLYLPPGGTAIVIFPASAVHVGLQVQIGCHSDNLTNLPNLKRPPVVVQRYCVDKVTLPVSTLFGGLIYIIIPGCLILGNIRISIEGAVLAPYFYNGETSDSVWMDALRHYPAPWAELETKNIIFTVPSDSVRALEKPSEKLALWDRIMEGVLKLSSLPAVLERKERIVADIQTSHGWMHSGYPIVCHLKSAAAMILVDTDNEDMWGALHELGHNQQLIQCEFPPHTTEALCNLWAIYVHENVLGTPREKAHRELQPHAREERIRKYLEEGAQLQSWNKWVCLETYIQLQEAFGWEPFSELFSAYRNRKDVKDDMKSKMNLWAELFSLQVQKNLLSFFRTWGWPIEEGLEEKLSSLPEWNENPMRKYIQSG